MVHPLSTLCLFVILFGGNVFARTESVLDLYELRSAVFSEDRAFCERSCGVFGSEDLQQISKLASGSAISFDFMSRQFSRIEGRFERESLIRARRLHDAVRAGAPRHGPQRVLPIGGAIRLHSQRRPPLNLANCWAFLSPTARGGYPPLKILCRSAISDQHPDWTVDLSFARREVRPQTIDIDAITALK